VSYTKEELSSSFEVKDNEMKLFIIDEVQLIYGLGEDHLFWKKVKKIMQGTACKMLLLAMYGGSPDRTNTKFVTYPY